MCTAKGDPRGHRRCPGDQTWHVNREASPTFIGDEEQERQTHKPVGLLSMKPSAIRVRRHRAETAIREVDSIRTVHGVAAAAPIGPVLRAELWAIRGSRSTMSLHALASRFEAIARDEDISVEAVAQRHERQTVRPHRMTAGQRLHDLVVGDGHPDYVDDAYLVAAMEPPTNGTPNPAYLRHVRDLAGQEWLLVSNFDGGEPMVWKHDGDAGLKAAAWECLQRCRSVTEDPSAFEEWLDTSDANGGDATSPYGHMSEADFLSQSDHMHLTGGSR